MPKLRRTFLFGLVLLCSYFMGEAQSLEVDKDFNLHLGSNILRVLPLEDGSYLVAGGFSKRISDTETRSCLLHYDARWNLIDDLGSNNDPLFTGSEDLLYDIRRYPGEGGNLLIVAGNFQNIRGVSLKAPIAIMDLSTGGRPVDWFRPEVDGEIMNAIPLADGKIIITGNFTKVNKHNDVYAIARLNADGSLDETFNEGKPGFTSMTRVFSSHLLRDGKILLGGSFSYYNGTPTQRILRLNPDGTLDKTFNHQQKSFDWVRSLEPDDMGRIIVAGDFEAIDGHHSPYVARLLENGSVDTGFVSPFAYNEVDAGAWCAIPYEGNIIVGLSRQVISSTGYSLAVLGENGTIQEGYISGNMPTKDVVYLKKLQDNSLLISGTFENYPSEGNSYNARFVPTDSESPDWESQGYKVLFHTDFEDLDASKYPAAAASEETIISVNGRRWRLRNGYIEEKERLNGEKSLCLIANYDASKPDCNTIFELIDPIEENAEGIPDGFYIRARMRGQDAAIASDGWYMAFSLDGGENWMSQPIISLTKGGLYNEIFPIEDQDIPGSTFIFKIYYESSRHPQGQRLLLDDISFYNGKDFGNKKPTVFSFLNLHEGYLTSQGKSGDGIPVLLDLNFARGLWNPNEEPYSPLFDSHILVKIDGKPYKELYSLPMPSEFDPITEHFFIEGIEAGKHTMEVILMNNATMEPWGPYPERTEIGFESGMKAKDIKGLKALASVKEGELVRITPRSDNPEDAFYVNYLDRYHDRRYVTDNEGYLLVHDPYGFYPVESEVPENAEYLLSIEGVYRTMDGIPMVQVIKKPDSRSDANQPYTLRAEELNLEDLNRAPDQYINGIFKIRGVSFAEKDRGKPFLGGASFTVTDEKSNSADLFIQFHRHLSEQKLHETPSTKVDMAAVVTRNYLTGKIALAPITWTEANALHGIDASLALDIHIEGKDMVISTPVPGILSIFDMKGHLLLLRDVAGKIRLPLQEILSDDGGRGGTYVARLEAGRLPAIALKISY